MEISYNKTKIVATVGPASNTKEMLAQLIAAGADVFRLNFSHGTHAVHQQVINYIRELNHELGTHVAMLQDLQGPKIRVEEVENNGVLLVAGQTIIITNENCVGTAQRVSTSYQALPSDVCIGDTILIDDGKIELRAIAKTETEVVCEIIYGGVLKSRKGINLPMTEVSAPSLTEKDYQDLMFGLQNNVEWVALSFVRTAADVEEVHRIIREQGKNAKVIAKIEKPQAVHNMDAIIRISDGIMVARGDLGVEMLMEDVPVIQKELVRKANHYAKPVIVATQMLESMIENPRPTRAEANDVANAVMDGADAVMLSAESAAGAYPVLSVQAMARIIKAVEDKITAIYDRNWEIDLTSPTHNSDNVLATACQLAKQAGARAIVAITSSGYSAFHISRHRPEANIFIFSRHRELLHRLNLLWGVRAYFYERTKDIDTTIGELEQRLLADGHLKKGDHYVVVASVPMEARGRANMIKLATVAN